MMGHERHPQAGTGIPQAGNINFSSPCCVSQKTGFAATANVGCPCSWPPEQNSFIPPPNCSDLLVRNIPLHCWGQGCRSDKSSVTSREHPWLLSSSLSNLSMAGVTKIPATTALPRAQLAHHRAPLLEQIMNMAMVTPWLSTGSYPRTEIRLDFPLNNKTGTTLILANQTSKAC